MKRTEYRKARRLLRENGRYALAWLTKEAAETMRALFFEDAPDPLAERADIVAYCKREGLVCNVRHTAAMRRG